MSECAHTLPRERERGKGRPVSLSFYPLTIFKGKRRVIQIRLVRNILGQQRKRKRQGKTEGGRKGGIGKDCSQSESSGKIQSESRIA